MTDKDDEKKKKVLSCWQRNEIIYLEKEGKREMRNKEVLGIREGRGD